MEPTTDTPNRTNPWKRYGPLIGVLVVVLLIAGAVLLSSRGDDGDDTAATDDTAVAGDEAPEGVISWSDAAADGTTDDIAWGERCDTTRGRAAFPSFFATECYAPFTDDNGGETAPGVTAESIKVVLYLTPETDPVIDFITSAIDTGDTNAQTEATVRGFMEFYEYFYETYGRMVDLEVFTGTSGSEDEVAARADAVTVAEMEPFAVLGGPLLTPAFADELAARDILCLQCTPGQDEQFYLDRAPNVWAVANSPEQGQAHVAEWIGKRLGAGNAEYAGDALRDTPRKFGLIYLSTSEQSEKVIDQLEADLATYDVTIAERISYLSPIDLQTTAPQLIAKMKDAGVTSVMFSGDPIAPQPLTIAATAQDYFPEWIIASTALVDTTTFARTYDQEQWAHAFGVSTLAARVNPERASYYYLYDWFFGEPPPTATGSPVTIPMVQLFYSILQYMGPDVTHQNFENAIFRSPPTASALSQPSLSWGDKGIWPVTDYLGIDDATEIWWDPTATGLDEIRREGAGMYQYVAGGLRYLPGAWPNTPPDVFKTEGAVTIYDEPPSDEQVPDYPPPNRGG